MYYKLNTFQTQTSNTSEFLTPTKKTQPQGYCGLQEFGSEDTPCEEIAWYRNLARGYPHVRRSRGTGIWPEDAHM